MILEPMTRRLPTAVLVVFAVVAVVILLLAGCGTPQPTDAVEKAATEDFEALPPELVAQAEALRDAALENRGAYEFLRQLTTEVGPRLAGSPGDRRAVAWATAKLRELGFSNVRAEEVTVPHWVRGEARGEIVAPYPQDVVLTALGGSVGTPQGGIEAEVVEVPSFEDLETIDPATVRGKIVFINRRMERARDGSGYGAAVGGRVGGPARAAELGAVAVLIRSVGTSNDRLAHTGTTRYIEGVSRIPGAALSNPDADLLENQLEAGEPVRFFLELGAYYLEDETSANVIGEILGREQPEEIVVLAGHLDSWDLGTGAIDDGAGCAVVTEAARLIGELPQAPRRTIRVFLAANEEFGLSGGRAYAERYEYAMPSHVAAIESDLGADRVWVLRSRVAEDRLDVVRDLARLLAPLGIEYGGNEAWGGADLRGLRAHRVPVFDLPQDTTRYFDLHHTANDTFDKVDPDSLAQNVAAYVTAAYVLAEIEGDLGRAPEREP